MNILKRKKEIRDRREAINKGLTDNSIKGEELRDIETEIESLNSEYCEIERREAITESLNNGTTLGKKMEIEKKGGTNLNKDLRSTPEYRTAFLNYLQGKETPEERAMTTTSSGVAIIPTQTFNAVMDNIKLQTGILPMTRILSMPGNLTIPQSQIVDPAAWHVQGTPISDTSKDPSSVTITGFELCKLLSMSVATQDMAIDAFESYLIDSLSYAMGIALDSAVINGLGPNNVLPQPMGIIPGTTWNASNSLTYHATSGLQYGDLTQAIGLLGPNFRQNAAFICNSSTLYSQFANMSDTMGRPIFLQNVVTGLPMTMLGKPIILDDMVPNGIVLFGNPQYYFMNFSMPMSIVKSYEAGFTSGSVIYRAMAVADGKPVAPAFIQLSQVA